MIHALFLSLTLTFQGPVHADLHPAEADLFIELGDFSALVPALEQAPLVRFLRDSRLKGLFDELGQSPEGPLLDMIKTGLGAAMPNSLEGGWLDGLRTVSVSFQAMPTAGEGAAPMGTLVLFDLSTPEQASALRSVLLAEASGHEPMEGALPGLERIPAGGPTGDFWCAAVGTRLVIGSGSLKDSDYAGRAEGKMGGLGSRESFKEQLAGLSESSGKPVLWFALTRPIGEIMKAWPESAAYMGYWDQIPGDMNPLASPRVARMELIGQRFITEMITSDVPGEAAQPIEAEWLAPVPPGSMIVYSSAFNGDGAGKRLRSLLAASEESAASLAAIEQKLGFGPERVLSRLGPGMTAYAAPLSGLGLPESRAWIECADPAGFTSDFVALVGALGETLPGFTAQTRPYKVRPKDSDERIEIPITTLTLPPGLIPIPMISLSPSFAPVGDKLVFGLSSMDVKSELKRVHGAKGDPIAAGSKPLEAMGFQLPNEAYSVFVMDWGGLIGSVIGMVQAFAGMAGPDAVPFDLKKLPSAEMVSEFFKPTFHYAVGAPGGTYRRNEASFGPETWLGVLGAVVGVRQEQGVKRREGLGGATPATQTPPTTETKEK